jgi:hypothetical protein
MTSSPLNSRPRRFPSGHPPADVRRRIPTTAPLASRRRPLASPSPHLPLSQPCISTVAACLYKAEHPLARASSSPPRRGYPASSRRTHPSSASPRAGTVSLDASRAWLTSACMPYPSLILFHQEVTCWIDAVEKETVVTNFFPSCSSAPQAADTHRHRGGRPALHRDTPSSETSASAPPFASLANCCTSDSFWSSWFFFLLTWMEFIVYTLKWQGCVWWICIFDWTSYYG